MTKEERDAKLKELREERDTINKKLKEQQADLKRKAAKKREQINEKIRELNTQETVYNNVRIEMLNAQSTGFSSRIGNWCVKIRTNYLYQMRDGKYRWIAVCDNTDKKAMRGYIESIIEDLQKLCEKELSE